ncbi:MAG: alpha-glucuronidase family glycosyl hydrolase [candidate division WOR-3 bacterium]
MSIILRLSLLLLTISAPFKIFSEDGYRLWLRYDKIDNEERLKEYKENLKVVYFPGNTPTLKAAREELMLGLRGLLGKSIRITDKVNKDGVLIVGSLKSSNLVSELGIEEILNKVNEEGFIIKSIIVKGKKCTLISARTDIGLLYGVFNFLRILQTQKSIENLSIIESPIIKYRILNHWDNLDRTVERGYAGFSIWDWHKLPDYIDPRYKDYARANASIGINGVVLTNVNANAEVLRPFYLEKVAALSNVFRPYGIKVYLTARFNAPMEIGGLGTADPLNKEVIKWWKDKVAEIYRYIPDFGGFLVKANSEGQPGPQDFGRTHADGANMLAKALVPYGGIVMWRAFVYDSKIPEDRAKQAYNEFKPLDGYFLKNVLIQVKNGPIDFQPREPFHPLFGAMKKTPLMMEFQITKEYLGFSTHLVYLAPLYKEVLDFDTYAKGKGSYVSKVVDGSLFGHSISGIAGVSNIGTDRDWCGSPFDQANWYAFGRLSWNHRLSSEEIAEEWIRMTFTNNPEFVKSVKEMMLTSREVAVNYMTPLGLHHIMGWGHHYGPAPWISEGRPDWTSVYYHKADSVGIGFDRTSKGSNAVSQYYPPVANFFSNLESCPDEYLLWFHHLPWDYKMKNGRTLWEELCYRYYEGVKSVENMRKTWAKLKGLIDEERYNKVEEFLKIQEKEAKWWRDACVLYFQTFSKKPIPEGLEKPSKSLEYYKSLNFKYVPGHWYR